MGGALPRHPDRLSAQDNAFFHLEDDGQAQNVGAMVLLGPHYVNGGAGNQTPSSWSCWRVALHLVPRLRQRFHELPGRLGPGRWVDDPDFDLEPPRAGGPGGPARRPDSAGGE